ncbi:AraC family transcriptional regulator [Stenotrophomonas sp.]|uniref:helix-turn-helix transcriptional regulator n=1 Tax=Stenotrophomonas sp. TaxID=69392 RepID=UPI002896B6F9|nr:AraC family transcriptional regulator [Stenotrophomonas sp.]
MSSAAFNLRRYGASSSVDRHDVAQWVVPLQGELAFELEGRGSRLDVLQGVFVAPHAGHAQTATANDRFLIVDCPSAMFDDDTLERLNGQPTLALPAAVRAMAQRLAALPGEAVEERIVERELPVLMQAFSLAGTATRLQAVCARIAQAPGQEWPVARIAAAVGVSGSRLHALFQQAFELSPQAWLSGCRLRWSRAQLVESDASIAEIAQRAGYSEQSALTRALRREWGMTPAEYRRVHRAPAGVWVKSSVPHCP